MRTVLLTLWLCGCAFVFCLPRSNFSQAQERRGQGVRMRFGAGPEQEVYAASYALVIGVSQYTNGWQELPGVRDDVPAVKAALEKQGFQVFTVLNPTRAQLDEELRKFVGVYGQVRNDRLLIYYAGHGHTLTSASGAEIGYLVPADAPRPTSGNLGEFKRLTISMSQMQSYIEQIEARHAMFVFDSCFAGTIFRTRNNPLPEAIAEKMLQPVRQFIAAGTATQTVLDQSPFRRAFVAGLTGAADTVADGFITGTELGEYINSEVTTKTKRKQTPQHGKSFETEYSLGDLVFLAPKREVATLIEPPKPQPGPPPSFDPRAVELAFWNSISSSRNASDFRAYLAKYPNGEFRALAENRLAELTVKPAPTPVITSPNANNPAPTVRTSVTGVPLRTFDYETASIDANGKVSAKRRGQAWGYTENINGVALEMVEIAGGTFTMGSPASEAERSNAEGPPHPVTVSGFALGKYEVTQAQWAAVAKLPKVRMELKTAPANFKGAELPVESISWEEAVEFCARLSGKTGRNYRLPTEAEWEYAARAGTQTAFAFGETITPEVVNYDGNYPYENAGKGQYRNKTVAVGSLGIANGFGLYDLHGNVREWCADWYGDYAAGNQTDPSGSGTGQYRVVRGGSWYNYGRICRSANRYGYAPGARGNYLGFRVVSSARTRP